VLVVESDTPRGFAGRAGLDNRSAITLRFCPASIPRKKASASGKAAFRHGITADNVYVEPMN